MKSRIVSFAFLVAFVAMALAAALLFKRDDLEPRAQAYPVEGLVMREDGTLLFEPVPPQDRKMVADFGFAQALGRKDASRVGHLIIHLDCHYFFTTDGRVLVMTVSGDGPTPRLVETKRWNGAPHEFRDYRKDLLPST
jgi:hypothetical protein